MKIGITGSTGFLGKNLVQELQKSHELFEYARFNRAKVSKSQITTINQVDVLLHLCEPGTAGAYSKEFSEVALYNLNQLCSNLKTRLIYFSSVLVYGLGSERPHPESDPVYSENNYTAHKLLAEEIARNHSSRIVRLPNLIGLGMHQNSVIKRFHKEIINRDRIIIESDDQRDYMDVTAASRTISVMLRFSDIDLINIGTGLGTKLSQLVTLISGLEGLDYRNMTEIKNSNKPASCIPDITRLRHFQLQGYHPPLLESLEKILKSGTNA